MTFCRRLPVTLLADDVGLGKTISAGLIVSELMVRRRVSRLLVICPSILCPQWIEELDSKFGIFGKEVRGQDLVRELRGNCPVVVTTYESASRYLEKIEAGHFDMLILDEAHKVRNLYGAKGKPQMPVRIHRALDNRLFKYVLMLTATPIQNRLWDLYSLIDCLTTAKGHRNPLGTDQEFKRQYINDPSRGARQLVPGREAAFRDILRQYIVRTRRQDAKLKFPTRQVRLFGVAPSAVEVQLQALVAGLIEKLNGLQQSSISRALFSSPQALALQLENMAQRDPGRWATAAREVRQVSDLDPPTAKLTGLLNIIDELRANKPHDWRLVIFTIRKETQQAIGRLLSKSDIPFGFIEGGRAASNQRTITAFRQPTPEINVIVSTDSGAEGINLQVANTVVNYDLPWNPMVVEQRIGRVQRLGAEHEHVVVFNLVVRGSAEEKVVARLMEKLQTISHTVGDIEAILESTASGQHDEAETFETQIRELVVKSLLGQNIQQATAMAERSIEAAQIMLEEQRHEIDATLGDLHDLHESGPPMPELKPVDPSTTPEDFILESLRVSGAKIEDKPGDMYTARWPGRAPERFTFDEEIWRNSTNTGIFMGTRPNLYMPGKPAFERMVQKWVDQAGHCVYDLQADERTHASAFARRWLTDSVEGASLLDVEIEDSRPTFAGSFLCKANAGNAVDSYEKIIAVNYRPRDHDQINIDFEDVAPMVPEALSVDKMFPALKDCAINAIREDPDIGEFSRFYQARLSEELDQAVVDRVRSHKVETDLRPHVYGEIVAVHGARYSVSRVGVTFSIDGQGRYKCSVEGIPATGQVITPPQFRRCEATDRSVPGPCLDRCEISGRIVLIHLLTESEDSGRRALQEHTAICEASGKRLLSDEVQISEVSGICAAHSHFDRSAISGRVALAEEMVRCAFADVCVLPDEIETSELSGKAFRKDQAVASALSGKRGHREEFTACAVSGDLVASDELAPSDVSGTMIRKDLLERSMKPPNRRGTPSEIATCEMTGKRLLLDEMEKSVVSNRLIDRDHLEVSEVSRRWALPEELATCTATGMRLLPDEMSESDLSGIRVQKELLSRSPVAGRLGLEDEFEACEITGARVLKDELLPSDLSGKRIRRDMVVLSPISGRQVHESEAVACEDGRRIPRDEVVQSDVSDKWCGQDVVAVSDRTGRRGAPDESVICEETKRRLLIDEAARCEVTDKLVGEDLLDRSERSGRRALKDLLVTCEVSGLRLLPDETSRCAVSGKRVDLELLAKSDESGAVGLKTLMERCAFSNSRVLPDELHKCEMTGDRVLQNILEPCAVTGRRARRDRMVQSGESGCWMLPDQAVRSVLDGKVGAPNEMLSCAWREGPILRSQSKICQRTGLTFSQDLIADSGEFEPLMELLNGGPGGDDASDIVSWLGQQNGKLLRRVKAVRSLTSPNGGVRALCAELRTMLGLKVRHAGVLIRDRGDRQIIGRVAIGHRGKEGWQVEQDVAV